MSSSFKHFSNWKLDQINEEELYETIWEESFYWQNKKRNEEVLQLDSGSIFNSLEGILKQLGQSFDFSFFTEQLGKSKYYSELVKEYIFEEIRQSHYPNKPSRQNCMFLAPVEVNIAEYGNNMNFDMDQLRTVQIFPEDNSIIHYANIELLNCNSMNYDDKVNMANQYWKGTNQRNNQTEVLFRGKFKMKPLIK